MSVENTNIIDFISEKGNSVTLTISDHLEWDGNNEHIFLLQEKINAYLMAIESGQINKKYPDLVGKKVAINIVFKHRPDENGVLFLSSVNDTLLNAGYGFEYGVFE
jgi:hypothetical protein